MIDKREQIARRCADILGEDHKLVKSIRLGFCYHHADVPRSIRRLLERAIKDETLPLIVSTTTLAQGVNLPIKNVIVHTLSFGGYISTTQFWNAAGRAGRAGYETEGHVVFCYRPDLERIVTAELEKSVSFVASGIRKLIESRLPSVETENEFIAQWALASTSQFRKDWESYDSWGSKKRHNAEVNKDEILAILDPQLLAWALEESVDEIDDAVVEKWIGKTLFAVQTLDIPEYVGKFKEINFYNDVLSTTPESTIAAIKALADKNLSTIIVGGFDRGLDYKKLARVIKTSAIKTIICWPNAGGIIAKELRKITTRKNLIEVKNMRETVLACFQYAQARESVVLSPAASSYDFYRDYREKGTEYKKLIRAYAKKQN